MKKVIICPVLLLVAAVLLSSCMSYKDPLASLREEQAESPTAEKSIQSGNTSDNESGKTTASGTDGETEEKSETEEEETGYDFSELLDLRLVVGGSNLIVGGYEYTSGAGAGVQKKSIYDPNDKMPICADPLCNHKGNSSCPFALESQVFTAENGIVYYQTKRRWTAEEQMRGEADDNMWSVCSYNTVTMEKKQLFERRDALYTGRISDYFFGEDRGKLYYTTYEKTVMGVGKTREDRYLCSYDLKTGESRKCFVMGTTFYINGNGINEETKKASSCIPLTNARDGKIYVTVTDYNETRKIKESKTCLLDLTSGKILEEIDTEGASLSFLDSGILFIKSGESGCDIEYLAFGKKERTTVAQKVSDTRFIAANSLFYIKFGDSPNRIYQYRFDTGRKFEYTFDCPLFTGEYHFAFGNSGSIGYCNGALIGSLNYGEERNGKIERVSTNILLDLTTGKWETGKPIALPEAGQRIKPDKSADLPFYLREITAEDEEKEGFVFVRNGDFYRVSYNGVIKGKVEIPREYNGLSVVEIAINGFRGQNEMTEVILPDTLKTVREAAFENCTALRSVVIPEGTKELLSGAFRGCTELCDVWLPSTMKTLYGECFKGCPSLDALHFADLPSFFGCEQYGNVFEKIPVPVIGENTPISLPEGIREIPANAFAGFTTITEIKIPSTVTEIGDGAFMGTGISELVIPDTVKKIGKYVVSDCRNLKKIGLPACALDAEYFFAGCSSLEKAELPPTVTSVIGAFEGCGSLREIYLPDSVTKIGSATFAGCTALEKISFSEKNLTEPVKAGCFKGCTALREITVRDKSNYISNGKYLVDNGAYSYGTLLFSSECDLRNVKGIVTVGSNTFENFDFGNDPVLLPDSVTKIGTSAFNNCRASFIDVGNGLKTIEEFAFGADGDIKMKIVLPVGLETIKPFGIAENAEIYYKGTSLQFYKISFLDRAGGNYKIYFYSETRPTSSGSYWHYIDGVPTAW